jgi:phenylalanine-4-hydroxylase
MTAMIVDVSTAEPTELLLDTRNPGRLDPVYLARRRDLFRRCREARLTGVPAPQVDCTEAELAVWRHVLERLDTLHERHACRRYLAGKRAIALETGRVPQVAELSHRVRAITGFELAPAEGTIEFREYFELVARGRFPVTQFLRHASDPEFTPEPDMIHDIVGHVPLLADLIVARVLRRLGQAALSAAPDQLLALNRFSWFLIEFGLVEEDGEVRILGAGILSSMGEIPVAVSSRVERRRFDLDEVVSTGYDATIMQDRLFVLESVESLEREADRLIARLGL